MRNLNIAELHQVSAGSFADILPHINEDGDVVASIEFAHGIAGAMIGALAYDATGLVVGSAMGYFAMPIYNELKGGFPYLKGYFSS